MMILRSRASVIITAIFLVIAALLMINPLEQFRRVQDRQLEADGQKLLGALEHYYKVFFEYPWEVLGEPKPNETAVRVSWLEELAAKEVVAPEFANHSSWRKIYITQNSVVCACFDPASGQFQGKADGEGKGRNGVSGCLSSCWVCQGSK